jgi:hypothetical protein
MENSSTVALRTMMAFSGPPVPGKALGSSFSPAEMKLLKNALSVDLDKKYECTRKYTGDIWRKEQSS